MRATFHLVVGQALTSIGESIQSLVPAKGFFWDEPDTPNSYFRSDEYMALSAEQKQAKLWSMTDAGGQSWFPFIGGFFFQDLNPSFDTSGDTMPDGWLFGTRTKYVHTVGVVGKVKFIAEAGSPYSGVFKGADYGLIRFSPGAQPSLVQPLLSGLALKLLRDGVDSANVVAMYSLDGQPGDWNFFSHEFWNHISMPENPVLLPLAAKFAEATPYVTQVSTKNFATYDAAGNAESSVTYPFSIGFKPTDELRNLFPEELQNLDAMAYMKQLPTVPADSLLYEVYAFDKPEELGGQKTLIGKVQLVGDLKTSKWADENLYFRHERVSVDIQDHPDWEPYEGKFEGLCPFFN